MAGKRLFVLFDFFLNVHGKQQSHVGTINHTIIGPHVGTINHTIIDPHASRRQFPVFSVHSFASNLLAILKSAEEGKHSPR